MTEFSLKDIADLITSSKVELFAKLDDKIDELNKCWEAKFSAALGEIKHEVNELRNHQSAMDDKYNSLDRIMHLNDAIIHGVPRTQEENLRGLFGCICKAIGYSVNDMALLSIFRGSKMKNSAIILKFISASVRNDFFYAYVKSIKAQPLTLIDLGFKTKDRVYIRESLCTAYLH